MSDLIFESATACASLIRDRKLSPVELVDAVLERIEKANPDICAFVSVAHEQAREAARVAEEEVISGKPLGLLHGVPYSLKDGIDIRGMSTSLGLASMLDNVAVADSPVAYLARSAGAVCIGKSAMPELGWSGITESPASGITRNPWDLSRSAGGSSGGAGAALAAGMGPLAIATDGGGSIRQPAAFNGIVGFKPSAGLVPVFPPSRFGPIGHYGPMARNVTDAALLLDVITGFDPRSDGALDRSFVTLCDGDLAGCQIGYSPTINGYPVDDEVLHFVEAQLDHLQDAGALVERIDLNAPRLEETWNALYMGTVAKQFDQLPVQARSGLSTEFLDFIVEARNIDDQTCVMAEIWRHEISRHVYCATRHLDLVVMPTTATVALFADRHARAAAAEKLHVSSDLFRLTRLWNITGQPALSVPAGWTKSGLPVGIQIIGHLGKDGLVLRAGKVAEVQPPPDRPKIGMQTN